MSTPGHNLDPVDSKLLGFVQRIGAIDQDLRNLRDDRKDVLVEAKAAGLDTKVITTILRRQAETPAQRDHRELVEVQVEKLLALDMLD